MHDILLEPKPQHPCLVMSLPSLNLPSAAVWAQGTPLNADSPVSAGGSPAVLQGHLGWKGLTGNKHHQYYVSAELVILCVSWLLVPM